MKLQPTVGNHSVFQQTTKDLLRGDIARIQPQLVDEVQDASSHGVKANHRVSVRHEKKLGMQVLHIVDNATGETVRKSHSDAQIDQLIRMQKLMGLHVDEEG